MASLISNSHKNAGMKQNTKVGWGGGGALPQKRQGCWLYLLGVKKKAVLVPLRVFNLKRSRAGAFVVMYLLGY